MNDQGTQVIDDPRSIRELLHDRPHVVMLTTCLDGEHSSRPLTCVDLAERRMSFLVNRQTDWLRSILDTTPNVHVTVSDSASNRYLALNGVCVVTVDEREIERLWTPTARAFFTGPDDPDIAVLHVDVVDGEYWDGPSGRLGKAIAIVRASLGGESSSVSGPVVGDIAGEELV